MKKAICFTCSIWLLLISAAFGWNYLQLQESRELISREAERLPNIKAGTTRKSTRINAAFLTGQPGQTMSRQQEIPFHSSRLQPIGSEDITSAGETAALPIIPQLPVTSMVISYAAIGLLGILGIIVFSNRLHQAQKQIKKQAHLDTLTGLPNQRCFTERLPEEFHRCLRDQRPISVIMSDIDCLKLYNDTYGRREGDACLGRIARAIQQEMQRPGDFCARYGSDEFVMILPDTSEWGAVLIAERIRAGILQMNIVHEKSTPLPIVTISLGVATSIADRSVPQEELIKHADTALSRAKSCGRNKVKAYHHAMSIRKIQDKVPAGNREFQRLTGPTIVSKSPWEAEMT